MTDRPAAFFDRDGTIIKLLPEGTYLTKWHQVEFISQIVAWIQLFNAMDWYVFIVTNQRAVAKGLISEGELGELHKRMLLHLISRGARVDHVFYCPHGIETCDCRKPQPGMLLQAKEQYPDIDMRGSLMIGDSDCDEKLADIADIPFIRVTAGNIQETVLPRKLIDARNRR